jgi:hypothetical protein
LEEKIVILKKAHEAIGKELALHTTDDVITEEELLHHIAMRVDYLLENDKDLLLSFLYRLDISMKAISSVLKHTHEVPAHFSLAKLILSRQIERIKTKSRIKVKPLGDEWNL